MSLAATEVSELGGSSGDDEMALANGDNDDMGDFPTQVECTAILTMKCGEPLMAVRKKLHDEIAIAFIPEEGFGVFQSKVERHFNKIGPTYVQEKRGIYLKPSSNATQSKYVQLTKENFDPLLRLRWKVARSMKVGLRYEVFCYFVDSTNRKDKKRMSASSSAMKMYHPPGQNGSDLYTGLGGGVTSASSTSALAAPGAITPIMPTDFTPQFTPQDTRTMGTATNSGSNNESIPINLDSNDRPRKIARSNKTPSTGGLSSSSGPSSSAPQPTSAMYGNMMPTSGLDLRDDSVFRMIPFRINGMVVPLEVDIVSLQRALSSVFPPPSQPHPAGGNVFGESNDVQR